MKDFRIAVVMQRLVSEDSKEYVVEEVEERQPLGTHWSDTHTEPANFQTHNGQEYHRDERDIVVMKVARRSADLKA